jgi:Family of unknown function (DUF6174)
MLSSMRPDLFTLGCARGLRGSRAGALAALAFSLLVAGCADDELKAARDRWDAAGVVDYDFRYKTTGFVRPLDHRISVRGEQVTAAMDLLAVGGPAPITDLANEPTVRSLFARIDGESCSADVTASYDANDGHPVRAVFDYGLEADGFETSELSPMPAR